MYYPTIVYTAYQSGWWVSWSQFQLTSGERQGTVWSGPQSIAGLTHRQTFTLTLTAMGNLEKQVDQMYMSVDSGRIQKHSEETLAGTGSNPEPPCFKAEMLPMASPCCLMSYPNKAKK